MITSFAVILEKIVKTYLAEYKIHPLDFVRLHGFRLKCGLLSINQKIAKHSDSRALPPLVSKNNNKEKEFRKWNKFCNAV